MIPVYQTRFGEESRRNRASKISAEAAKAYVEDENARAAADVEALHRWYDDAPDAVRTRVEHIVQQRVRDHGGSPSRGLLATYHLAAIMEERAANGAPQDEKVPT